MPRSIGKRSPWPAALSITSRRHCRAGTKYAGLKERIHALFEQHKGRYGYRRIMAAIRCQGGRINTRIQCLIGELSLNSCIRPKKYKSFKGNVGKIAPNVLKRKFGASCPNQKWVTDVTEFNVGGQKLYLSPVVLDVYNGEIVAYEVARRPQFDMVNTMLNRAFTKLGPRDKPILHSNQGHPSRRHLQQPTDAFRRRRCHLPVERL
ncbi:helix-turn-helix protein [Paraburkholderia sp. RAU2J]|nr:helix-turn-helix protein [Paraburkholderia sp. RAU2J]